MKYEALLRCVINFSGLFVLFRLFKLFFFLVLGGLLEILDALAQPTADFREFSCAKDYNNDYQDNDKFRHAESEHEATSRVLNYMERQEKIPQE